MRLLGRAILSLSIVACTPPPAASPAVAKPSTPSEEAPPKPVAAEPAPAPTVAAASSNPSPAPEAEPTPDPCGSGWTCIKVALDSKAIEKRPTRLIGDPKIEETWSKWSDGRVVTYEAFSQGAVEFMLRRKPGNKNELVVKPPSGGEIIIDRRDGTVDDFTHVDFIAADQHGQLLVDFRYSKF